MPKVFLALSILTIAALTARAETFDSRFEEGFSMLRAGNPEGALESFQKLLTEEPNSELVQYSIAAALYEKGLKNLAGEVSEEAMESLYQARDGFDKLRNSRDTFLRRNAPFNAANSTAQVAKHLDPGSQYNERVQALQDAIQAYEVVVRQHPDHDGARVNLNHSRYLLKSMMQNAPPEQERADDGEGGEQGEQGENEDQSDEGEEGEQDQDSQEGEEGEQDQEGEEDSDPSDNENSGGDPQDASSQGDPLKDENIEAILQSLEDKNREEQKNLRKAKGPPSIREGKWW